MYLLNVFILLLVILASSNCIGPPQNELGGELDVECLSGYGLVRVQSTHDANGGNSDRQWLWECTKIDIWHKDNCFWYENITAVEQPMFFQCPANAFMAGVRSLFDTDSDDRTWSVKCCRIETVCMHRCTLSDVVADFTEDINHSADDCNSVFVGIYSYFNPPVKDRRFMLQECQFRPCREYLKKTLYK